MGKPLFISSILGFVAYICLAKWHSPLIVVGYLTSILNHGSSNLFLMVLDRIVMVIICTVFLQNLITMPLIMASVLCFAQAKIINNQCTCHTHGMGEGISMASMAAQASTFGAERVCNCGTGLCKCILSECRCRTVASSFNVLCHFVATITTIIATL